MMHVRRLFQSTLALALCLVLLGDLGAFYFVPAGVAMLIAMSTGVYVLIAIGAGLLWPVLAIVYVLYVVNDARLRAQAPHDGARSAPTAESDGARIEDA
jgi:hypothetical protein